MDELVDGNSPSNKIKTNHPRENTNQHTKYRYKIKKVSSRTILLKREHTAKKYKLESRQVINNQTSQDHNPLTAAEKDG